MRSSTWITVLVGLFMFQSFWNVAAAFCVHEQQPSLQQSYHFGHHQNTLCTSDQGQNNDDHQQAEIQKASSNDLKIGEDHQDHLPSMTHLLVQNEKFDVVHPNFEIEANPQFYWKNGYQPPDLLLQSPPPEFSPLMVG